MQTAIATLTPITNEQGSDIPAGALASGEIKVQFNPETLDMTFTNAVQKGQRRQPPQVVTETKSQLNFELLFDTTLSGMDVRKKTLAVAKLMDPKDAREPTRRDSSIGVPSKVMFEWGSFKFEGYIDNIKEKLDFFSDVGIPLRSTLTISMTNAQRNLIPSSDEESAVENNADFSPDAIQSAMPEGQSISELTKQLGDESAARALGAANGIENLRLPEVNSLLMLPSVELRASAAFGGSVNAEISLEGSANLNIGGSAIAGTNSSLGGNASASLSSESLFGGLKSSASVSLQPKIDLAVSANLASSLSADLGGQLDVGLDIGLSAGASMKADVGVNADFEAGIKFEEN